MAFFGAFGVDVFKLAFQIINFLLILYLLNRFLFKRVLALLDERQELLARPGQVIGEGAPARRAALEDALGLELLESVGEERRRHQRHAAAQLGEALRAGREVPDDQGGPPLAEDLGGLGHRTELTVALHDRVRLRLPP